MDSFFDTGPDVAQWAAIKKAADTGDESKTAKACNDAGLDSRLARLFVVVMAFAREAAEADKAAAGAAEQKRDMAERLKFLRNASPKTLDEVDKFAAETRRCQSEHDKAVMRLELARCKSIELSGLQERFAKLFGD
jgi:hypothetical protein